MYRLKKPRICNNVNIRNNYPVSEIMWNKFAGTAAKDETDIAENLQGYQCKMAWELQNISASFSFK